MRPLLIPVSIGLVVASLLGLDGRPGTASPSVACSSTTVHYNATPLGLPHIRSTAVTGNLLFYTGPMLMDGRVNRSDGIVAYAGDPGAKPPRILWTFRRRAGRVLRVVARRLDGPGILASRWRRVGEGEFLTTIKLPTAGCWRLELSSGSLKARFVLRAIEPPARSVCDATPVYRGTPQHPRFGAIEWMPATPRSGRVAAVLFVTVYPDRTHAVIPARGHFPGGPDTKFLWWAPQVGGPLRMIGTRLDKRGAFRSVFNAAVGDVGIRRRQIVYPSVVDVPVAGCWSVLIRTGRSGGLVVFEVLDPQRTSRR